MREGAARTGPGWLQTLGPATTTVLLRHGETALSGERRFAGRGDIPLTGTGLKQAAAAAARLAARGGLDLIVTSPLERTRQTADAAAAATGVPLVVEDGWMETDFGEWEGLNHAEAERGWPEQMAAWLNDTGSAPPGGESFASTSDRVLKALDSLLVKHAGSTVLVVSHVTPMKILLLNAMLAPPAALRRIQLDVACLCEIDWYAGGIGVVRSVNDTAHLSLPGMAG
ncbi:MAG TPA: histidine phosphatase family protein [Streptosporangiaceae bacterium]|jgi:probable phosphoglycerate mutase|nr:histidine phosphatase family protein [Streptosporangiaceae bacterium]